MDRLIEAFGAHADAIAVADARVPTWSGDDAACAARIDALRALPDAATLRELAMAVRPWRKGPWSLPASDGTVEIDAEWRADWKWERLRPFFAEVSAGARIADIGCGNGYYLRRLAELEPSLLVGVDPQPKAVLQHRLAARLDELAGRPTPPTTMRRWRLDALAALPGCFDAVLCAGLLYHVTDPIEALRQLWRAVAPGGLLVLETIVVPGEDPIAWTPPRRYAGARGFWSLPTQPCLAAWIERAGLRVVQWSESVPTTPDEQRSTEWTFGPGLAAGLDPDDPARTVEGLPAPERIIAAIRPG